MDKPDIDVAVKIHIYQPGNQRSEVVQAITEECYKPLMYWLIDNKMPLSVNEALVLIEQWVALGRSDMIGLTRGLGNVPAIEFVGSLAYHGFGPLITPRQFAFQSLRQRELAQFAPSAKQMVGFFPPEMAIRPDEEFIRLVRGSGAQWMITCDQPFAARWGFAPNRFVPTLNGFPVPMRSHLWSSKIADHHIDGDDFANQLLWDFVPATQGQGGYVIVALDGETFGHHIPGYIERFFDQFWQRVQQINADPHAPARINVCHISDIVNKYEHVETYAPQQGSWSTTVSDAQAGNHYPMWLAPVSDPPLHEAHQTLWALVALAEEACAEQSDWYEELARRGEPSCLWWQAAKRHEGDIGLILRGADTMANLIELSGHGRKSDALILREKLEQPLRILSPASFV